jgi:hypothetical protein
LAALRRRRCGGWVGGHLLGWPLSVLEFAAYLMLQSSVASLAVLLTEYYKDSATAEAEAGIGANFFVPNFCLTRQPFSPRLSKPSDYLSSVASIYPSDSMDPVGPEEPDDPDIDSILDTASNSLSEATMDVVRRPNPQATPNLDAPGVASTFISLFSAIQTTGGRTQLRWTNAQSTSNSNHTIWIIVDALDEVEGHVPLVWILTNERWTQSPTTDELRTALGSRFTQSNVGSLLRAMFPPIIALPQTEALRARAAIRNRLRRRRNLRLLDTSNTTHRNPRV